MSNVVLIGMPASGKSTIGVVLAKILGLSFTDTDLVIQNRTGRSLQTLIRERGQDGFISLENEICSRIDARDSVIATGGSVVYGGEAMRHLRENGIVVYLETDYEVLKKRLHHMRRRGVVFREGQTLEDIFRERKPLYERYADVTVREGLSDSEEVVEQILEKLLSGWAGNSCLEKLEQI